MGTKMRIPIALALTGAVLLACGDAPAPAQGLSGAGLSGGVGKAYPYKLCGRTGTPVATTSAVEAPLASCRVPAGLLGADGCLLIMAHWYASTQSGVAVVRFHSAAGLGGGGLFSATDPAGTEAREIRWVCNVNAANSQQVYGGTYMSGTRTGSLVLLALNTANDAWVNFNGSATAGGTLTLQDWSVIAMP